MELCMVEWNGTHLSGLHSDVSQVHRRQDKRHDCKESIIPQILHPQLHVNTRHRPSQKVLFKPSSVCPE